MSEAGPPIHAVAWRRIDRPGMEVCILSLSPAPRLAGTVLGVADEAPVRVDYDVLCDEEWNTKVLSVSLFELAGERTLEARRVGDGWDVAGGSPDALAGCIDVDLAFSPSTNTLPIRRLALEVRESADIAALYVDFPSLAVSRARQRYTRLAERRYRYESLQSSFVAELEVDDLGLVLDYPRIWERVAGRTR